LPNRTFWNLPQEKRLAITRAAAEEFAGRTYETASLSRIVERLGIAKGSMYQYFDNKTDLYRFVVEDAYKTKKGYLDPVWAQDIGFFERIKAYYQAAFAFSQDHPLYHRVIHQFWESRDVSIQADVQQALTRREMDFQRLLEEAAARGEIKEGMSRQAAFFAYHSVGKQLIEDFAGVSKHEQRQHQRFIEQVLDVLELGLRADGRLNSDD